MPVPQAKPKPAEPNSAQTIALRHRLERGVAALRTALQCLALSPEEQKALEALVAAQSRRAKSLAVPRKKQTKPRVEQLPEVQASRAAENRARKQQRDEREKRMQMLKAKRDAEIREVHRKSGYSEYVRRVPGSFEGGKK